MDALPGYSSHTAPEPFAELTCNYGDGASAPRSRLPEPARALLRGTLWTGWTLGLSAAARAGTLLAPPHERHAAWRRWVALWAHGVHRLLGFDYRCHGFAPGENEGARLVVANHRSALDVTILLSRFGGCCLSRADLARWPVIGPAARRAGTIFVDRSDRRSGASAIRAIRSRLQAGRTVILFPEGATSRGDQVRDFHAGALAAARGLEVEVVPVGLAYPSVLEFHAESFEEFLRRAAAHERPRACVQIGRPRPLGSDVREEARMLRAEVQDLVDGARRLCAEQHS